MNIFDYDDESDSLYVHISSKKAFYTLEVSERVGVDSTQSRQVVGVEILDASKFLSELFNKAVSKESIKRLLCNFTEGDSITLNLQLGKDRATYALPKPYFSPVLSA